MDVNKNRVFPGDLVYPAVESGYGISLCQNNDAIVAEDPAADIIRVLTRDDILLVIAKMPRPLINPFNVEQDYTHYVMTSDGVCGWVGDILTLDQPR